MRDKPLHTQRMQKMTDNYVVSNDKMKVVLGMKEKGGDSEDTH